MKELKITWTILFTLITIAVAFLVLTVGQTKFENVVTAVLVELYALLRGMGFGFLHLFLISEQAGVARFIELSRLLNDRSAEHYETELKAAAKTARERMTRHYIEMAGIGIISIVATLKLLIAIF
jgi:hypothetical protein